MYLSIDINKYKVVTLNCLKNPFSCKSNWLSHSRQVRQPLQPQGRGVAISKKELVV